MLGWEASHKKFCSPDSEERKVKESGKRQRAAGCVWLDEQISEESGEEYFEQDKRVKELVCKKGGSSRKSSTRAQNEGSAAVKEGNTWSNT